MADQKFLILDDFTALAFDKMQWIIHKRGNKNGKFGPWKPKSFIRSDKTVLLRCLGENGCDVPGLSKDALAELEALPDTFKEWYTTIGIKLTEERKAK